MDHPPTQAQIQNMDSNFSIYINQTKYNCFYNVQHNEIPNFPPIEELKNKFVNKMRNKCQKFTVQLCDTYRLCHFKQFKMIHSCNKSSTQNFSINYQNEPFEFDKNISFYTKWKQNPNFTTTFHYNCDLSAPEYGRISKIHHSKNNFNVSIITPLLCETNELWPPNISTVKCFPNII